jgi:hypothetical protein
VTLGFCQLHRNWEHNSKSNSHREILFSLPENTMQSQTERKQSPFRKNLEDSEQNYTESDLQLILLNQKLKDKDLRSWKDSLENSLDNSFEELHQVEEVPLIFEAENFKSFEIAKVQDSHFNSKIDPLLETFQIKSKHSKDRKVSPEYMRSKASGIFLLKILI